MKWLEIEKLQNLPEALLDPTYGMSVLYIQKKVQLVNIMAAIKKSYCAEISVAFTAT